MKGDDRASSSFNLRRQERMVHHMKVLLSIVITFLSLGIATAFAQVAATIPVSYPISGYYTFDAGSRLILVDTYDGATSTLQELEHPRPIKHPHWNNQGDSIVYAATLDTLTLQPFATPPLSNLLLSYQSDTEELFSPKDWSPDGSNVLGVISGVDVNYNSLQIVNVNDTNSRTTLRQYIKGEPFPEDTQRIFNQISLASWNPVYEHWIIAEIETTPVGEENNPEPPRITIGLVFNYVTEETHLLDSNIVNSLFAIASDPWSPDGRAVLVETGLVGDQTQIVALLDGNGNWQPQVLASAPDEQLRYLTTLGWLGVEDLILLREQIADSDDEVYHIAQIVDGQLLTQEFFHIPVASGSSISAIGTGSWHLTADEAEQATLSCIFDHTLSTQLAVGMNAQVTFTGGTSSRLRATPGTDGAEVTRMPEGTAFTIIGGSWCADGYRWWQLQLPDGTAGWSAEADTQTYFLEPLA